MDIKKLRVEIDKIDRKVLQLLIERAKISSQIGKFKKVTGEEFYLPHREKKILSKLLKFNTEPLSKKAVLSIFQEILHSCRSVQKKLRVAYLGPEATFTHLAAVKNFGSDTDYIPLKSIADVFSEVEKSRADYGVVPIENSTEGVVNHTLDMFIESDLLICAELNLPIRHCLLSREKSIQKIKKVYSHSQALAQCRNWLEANLPGTEVIELGSTAEAAKKAAVTLYSAAIASSLAAELYSLNILLEGIEDAKENYTRFLVIGKNITKPSGYDKTSIMFSIKDRVGALHDMLTPFKRHKINLTKIESRPTRKKAWEYIFFVDFIGHTEDKSVQKALQELEKQCLFVKVLGSYPRAE